MNYYNVYVTISPVYPNGMEHKEIIPFKSRFSAKYMAKKYYDCVDVAGVDVIDQTTGEVIYYHNKDGEEYDAGE